MHLYLKLLVLFTLFQYARKYLIILFIMLVNYDKAVLYINEYLCTSIFLGQKTLGNVNEVLYFLSLDAVVLGECVLNILKMSYNVYLFTVIYVVIKFILFYFEQRKRLYMDQIFYYITCRWKVMVTVYHYYKIYFRLKILNPIDETKLFHAILIIKCPAEHISEFHCAPRFLQSNEIILLLVTFSFALFDGKW